MSSETVLSVKSLSKVYRIYRNPIDRIRELYSIRRRVYHDKFSALEDINFDVFRGETVGIIGPNGSGKSTLLEIVAGTLSPTTGSVEKAGTVAALLELGAGFNPAFSGRDNVYLNASILGIPKQQVEENFADILAFADIGEFIDHPVRRIRAACMYDLHSLPQSALIPIFSLLMRLLQLATFGFNENVSDDFRRCRMMGKRFCSYPTQSTWFRLTAPEQYS